MYKTHQLRTTLEVEMSKKCTPVWREAHFEVKMYKAHQGFGSLLEVEMSKKCTPLWREAHFQVKMYKTPQLRTTFGGSDVEKVYAVVVRSTCRGQNAFRCKKHTSFGALLEVEMSKKCTLLWREAHFEVKMYKAQQNTTCSCHFWRFRCAFACQARRDCAPSQK